MTSSKKMYIRKSVCEETWSSNGQKYHYILKSRNNVGSNKSVKHTPFFFI